MKATQKDKMPAGVRSWPLCAECCERVYDSSKTIHNQCNYCRNGGQEDWVFYDQLGKRPTQIKATKKADYPSTLTGTDMTYITILPNKNGTISYRVGYRDIKTKVMQNIVFTAKKSGSSELALKDALAYRDKLMHEGVLGAFRRAAVIFDKAPWSKVTEGNTKAVTLVDGTQLELPVGMSFRLGQGRLVGVYRRRLLKDPEYLGRGKDKDEFLAKLNDFIMDRELVCISNLVHGVDLGDLVEVANISHTNLIHWLAEPESVRWGQLGVIYKAVCKLKGRKIPIPTARSLGL